MKTSGGDVVTVNTLEHRVAWDSLVTLAAWGLVVGALMQVVLGIPLAALEEPSSPAHGPITVFNVVNHLLLLAGVLGLARNGAAGRSRLALSGLTLAAFGTLVLTLAEPVVLLNLGVANVIFGIAVPAMALGLILAGFAVLRERRWVGWHRFTPLACGVFIPLVLIPSFALPGLWFHYAIGVWGIFWLLLGLALRAEAVSAFHPGVVETVEEPWLRRRAG
jgi:hypothetical protein